MIRRLSFVSVLFLLACPVENASPPGSDPALPNAAPAPAITPSDKNNVASPGVSGATGPTADAPPPEVFASASAFLLRKAELFCANVQPCCALAGNAYDADGCRAAYLDTVDDTLVGVDQAQARLCLEQMKAAISSCTPTWQTSCVRALVSKGSVKPGEPCESDNDCAPPTKPGGYVYCGGTCITVAPGAVGDVCFSISASTQYECPADAYCPGDSEDERSEADAFCTSKVSKGGACADDSDCLEASSFCSFENEDLPVCELRVARGGACNDYLYCALDSYCDGATCVAKKSAGAACASYQECEDGLRCDNNAKKCVPNPRVATKRACGGK